MKKLFLLILILMLPACEKAVSTVVFEKIPEDGIILAFGDSLTYGTGSTHGADYPNILSQMSSREVINLGVPGEVSKTGLDRLPNLLDQYQPELLILIHGGNDILRKIPLQQTADNLKQMINEARQREIRVVMVGVPKPNFLSMDSAEIYQQVADQLDVPIDLEVLPEILSDNQFKSDTIHPNDKGYKIMAEKIFTLLVATGAL